MTDESEGLRIARERIAREAEERTGFLDLGRLGLTELPEELFELQHLQRLNLGAAYWDEGGEWQRAAADLAPNEIEASLTALRRLPMLSVLSLRTLLPVSSLSALVYLANLQTLDCYGTQVSDLAPLAGLEKLQKLDLSRCQLVDVPRWLLERESLNELILHETHVPGLPAEVLSQGWGGNCLETLRAHVRDLEAGAVAVRDVKLLVLGNGRVGKTQLCRRLRGEAFDEAVASTHGIVTTRAPLPAGDGAPETTLQVWDFGGQDLYHGTHALFMRANAVFLLVWTPVLEDTHEETHDGVTFRNHPLAYWVDYVRHLGGKRSAVVVVQTRCDKAVDEKPCPVAEADMFAAFGFPPRIVRYSASTNRGRGTLDEALAEATAWLRDQEGIATIGAGRARVKERLEALRDADAAVPLAERQYRTISQAFFHHLCDESGGVSAPEHLLAYLHNAGIVFYRAGLFDDAIILDQNWALDAIYAVFHREKCYRRIRQNRGRFIRNDLADWVWAEHGAGEQELFLSMMQSCSICFEHRPATDGTETEYIAPELLPARADLEIELAQKWDNDRPIETATYAYAQLHPGLIRSIISRIGQEAGLAADYWQGGVYVYETTTNSRGIIEAEMLDAWRGRIRLQTQRGRAAELLARLRALVEEEQSKAGLTPVEVKGGPAGLHDPRLAVEEPDDKKAMKFGKERSGKAEWYVSYAWGDDTPDGQEREAIIDRLCNKAEARGFCIHRDKNTLGLGERISKFMNEIGEADRVFVILSDKYLKSEFCMYELSEVWRNCRQNEHEFLNRIRVYTLSCARIWKTNEQFDYIEYWDDEYQAMDARVAKRGLRNLGAKQAQKIRLMSTFSQCIGDILATLADIRQPRNFEELERYGFSD